MLLVGVEVLDGRLQFAADVGQTTLAAVEVDRHTEEGAPDRIGRMALSAGFGEAGIDVWTDN